MEDSKMKQVEEQLDLKRAMPTDDIPTGDRPPNREEEVKYQRRKVDSLFLTCKTLPSSREISLAVTSFQNARQNMGLVLGELGSVYPYKDSMDATKATVNPQADKGEVLGFQGEGEAIGTVEGKLAGLREFAGKCIDEWDAFVRFFPVKSPKMHVALHQALGQLMNGKMWLGEALAARKIEAAGQQTEKAPSA